jgi:cysteine desulfurase
VAAVLGCDAREVVFVSSGSEANALAIRGAFLGRADATKKRLVISAIEHPALLMAVEELAGQAEVVRVPPGSDGRVDPSRFIAELTPSTAVASLMWANNETGVLQPVAEIARACQERGIPFHSDAVQAVGKVPVSLGEVPASLLSLSAHKFGGPAGVGVLVLRRSARVRPLIAGHQEAGRRGGTQNVVGAEALALALELVAAELGAYTAEVGSRRDAFERELLAAMPGARINGARAPRVPNTTSATLPGVDCEALLISLDLAGIQISTGAACASGSLKPSHVLLAMGLTSEVAHHSIRVSIGRDTTLNQLSEAVDRIRSA